MRKHAFTIIELMVVVVIIGVLATIAIPQFSNAVEKTKVAKAKSNLAVMYKAISMCGDDLYGGNGDYSSSKCNNDAALLKYTEFAKNDSDWTYAYSQTATTFNATAARRSGVYSNCLISIDQNKTFSSGGTCVAHAV